MINCENDCSHFHNTRNRSLGTEYNNRSYVQEFHSDARLASNRGVKGTRAILKTEAICDKI